LTAATAATLLFDTIITFSNNIDAAVLAEGIEAYGRLEQLKGTGYELGQGYFFSAALVGDKPAGLLERLSSLTR